MILWLLACERAVPAEGDSGLEVESVPCEACAGECLESSASPVSGSHVEGAVDYSEHPPLGGDHNACWAAWGVHEEEVPAENWVHNLEHGGVVVLADCGTEGCAEDWAALATWTSGLPEGRAVLSRYEGAEFPYTVVSWGHRLGLGCVDLVAMQAFFDANVGQGPEDATSEPGSGCM